MARWLGIMAAAALACACESRAESADEQRTARCNAGEAQACAELADSLLHGPSGPQDPSRAAELYRKACHTRVPAACQKLVGMYNAGQLPRDPAAETALLETACTDGHGNSCGYLGTWYMDGAHPGVAKNASLAFELFTKGCERADALSCHNLAIFHTQGTVGEVNSTEAASLFDKACAMEHLPSCSNLGIMYGGGVGVARDPEKALTLFRKACGGGDEGACNNAKQLERGR